MGGYPHKKLSTKVRWKKNGFGHFWIFKNVQNENLLEKFWKCVFFGPSLRSQSQPLKSLDPKHLTEKKRGPKRAKNAWTFFKFGAEREIWSRTRSRTRNLGAERGNWEQNEEIGSRTRKLGAERALFEKTVYKEVSVQCIKCILVSVDTKAMRNSI